MPKFVSSLGSLQDFLDHCLKFGVEISEEVFILSFLYFNCALIRVVLVSVFSGSFHS
jgi:hypothetical protein